MLGLGEAGSTIAADLVALGVAVVGWDPDASRNAEGVRFAESAAGAARGADVVLSLNSSTAAVAAARSSTDGLSAEQVYADLNTTSPAVKLEILEVVRATGAAFADVALLAPVPGRGIRTPALASGSGAESFAHRFGALGMPVEVVGTEPGLAAKRKLVRSVFMKGLAAAVAESLLAAEAAGCEGWLRGEIERTLESADAALVERLVVGSRRHAVRRADEMDAACELLRDLGVEPRISQGAATWLADLAHSAEVTGA